MAGIRCGTIVFPIHMSLETAYSRHSMKFGVRIVIYPTYYGSVGIINDSILCYLDSSPLKIIKAERTLRDFNTVRLGWLGH